MKLGYKSLYIMGVFLTFFGGFVLLLIIPIMNSQIILMEFEIEKLKINLESYEHNVQTSLFYVTIGRTYLNTGIMLIEFDASQETIDNVNRSVREYYAEAIKPLYLSVTGKNATDELYQSWVNMDINPLIELRNEYEAKLGLLYNDMDADKKIKISERAILRTIRDYLQISFGSMIPFGSLFITLALDRKRPEAERFNIVPARQS